MVKQIVRYLFFLVIIGLVSACVPSWPPLSKPQIQVSSSCSSNADSSRCSITMTSDAGSPHNFDWKATVQPSSVSLGISSGTLTPGGKIIIQFQFPSKQCPINVTFVGSDGTVVKT